MVTEWRVTVRLPSASRTSRAVLQHQVADGLRDRLGQLAAVSAGSPELFVYADTEAAASEQATGVAQWTVRVTLSSRHDAMQLARRLSAEGVPVLRRGKSVVLGASNEDAARELALRAAEQVPAAAEVHVERTFVWSPPADFGPFWLA